MASKSKIKFEIIVDRVTIKHLVESPYVQLCWIIKRPENYYTSDSKLFDAVTHEARFDESFNLEVNLDVDNVSYLFSEKITIFEL